MAIIQVSQSQPCIVTINGGSSTIKFGVFTDADEPKLLLNENIDRIDATNPEQAAKQAVDRIVQHVDPVDVVAIGHRVVHGGPRLVEHQIFTPDILEELRRTVPLDLAHLPQEIALIEACGARFNKAPQVACFDTAFHRELPQVAQMLPIPRRFEKAGVRRFGFHGLSYSYLMEELTRTAGAEAANARVILAHLGSGASMAAVRGGKPIDTTMAFTPTAGLVMATRPGDMDPGLLTYIMSQENLTPEQMDEFVSRQCGLIGVSETSSDMRDLLARRDTDVRSAQAVDLFCYQAKKWIGAYAAALGGLDTLVFAGGIGEHASPVRAQICDGLEFLGVRLDPMRNAQAAPVISMEGGRVTVRVIRTDEDSMIARLTRRVLAQAKSKHFGEPHA